MKLVNEADELSDRLINCDIVYLIIHCTLK